jgi:deoxyribodipyrimidine photolyase
LQEAILPFLPRLHKFPCLGPIRAAITAPLFWFRRGLRDYDNADLCHALKSSRMVSCALIFDREILDELPSSADRRVEFIWENTNELRTAIENLAGSLIVRHARSSKAIPRLAAELKVIALFANDDQVHHARRAPGAAGTPLCNLDNRAATPRHSPPGCAGRADEHSRPWRSRPRPAR